ncbi:MAG TPA: VacJ family lipoprotein [Noviherbaspirillum sp.]|uniref:MlaA family lipoprotein n=1 Tax=Noviherbaspirillum sp. TaxID=1926288 RepID=UPI002B49456C|nr:VacJ family lipoprotein [Noviherbaspirillum sp.]HJV87859.1 VacJ family lipoprotein [Noviherbaspirillum sp.]
MSLVLGGCATTANPRDPFENFNRAMFQFNDAVDRAALKPAAEGYAKLPGFVQTGVSNFFGNLGDVWTAINNFLQGKAGDGMSDVMRVAVNTTMGLGGVLDISSEAGLTKHKEDFGQTLGKWGIKSGPYVVLPLLGPSTLRDTLALPLDSQADPWYYVYPVYIRNSGTVLRAVDQRAAILDASNLLEEAALDRYVFVRDAFLQRRESKVHDGAAPESHYEDDVGPTFTEDDASGSQQNAATLNGQKATDAEPAAKPVVEVEQNGAGKPGATSPGTDTRQ